MSSTSSTPTSADPVILTSIDDKGVGRIILNRPHAMNAVTVELAQELHRALMDIAPRARVIVLSGSNGNFSVGGDFHELERLRAQGVDAMAELFDSFRAACKEIERLPIPVIAAVEGYAMAGGFELMQASDFAVVHENCKLADTHTNHGQIPGGGGSQLLPRLVGRQCASAHILTGDRLTAQDAVSWGLAYKSFSTADFEDQVTALACKLASKNPAALAKSKRLIRDGLTMTFDEGLEMERTMVLNHLASGDAGQGIEAFTGKGSQS